MLFPRGFATVIGFSLSQIAEFLGTRFTTNEWVVRSKCRICVCLGRLFKVPFIICKKEKGEKMKKYVLVLFTFIITMSLIGCSSANNKGEDYVIDPAGIKITIPKDVERIVSLAPATTQILCEISCEDKIVAVDTYSPIYVEGLTTDILQLDMMAPDLEALIAIDPDIIFVSDMSNAGADDIFLPIREAGITVVTIPTANSLQDIAADVRFVAECVDKADEGNALVDSMQEKITAIEKIASTITEPKSVSFEISAIPYLYSTGTGTYLDDMIRAIGATNIYADEDGWVSITEEAAVAKNPDVILTNVNYMDDAVGEILARSGWDGVTAVMNQAVYYIDNATSSIPNHHIVDAMVAMAKAIYPEAYKSLE